MNFLSYTAYFHDGSLIDIKHVGDCIGLILESSEIDPSALQEAIILSKKNTMKGELCIMNVKKIFINDDPIHDHLKMKYPDAEILNLEVCDTKVSLLVEWKNSPPKGQPNDVSHIEIGAEEIYWRKMKNFH